MNVTTSSHTPFSFCLLLFYYQPPPPLPLPFVSLFANLPCHPSSSFFLIITPHTAITSIYLIFFFSFFKLRALARRHQQTHPSFLFRSSSSVDLPSCSFLACAQFFCTSHSHTHTRIFTRTLNNSHSTACLLIKNPLGSHRICVDYQSIIQIVSFSTHTHTNTLLL